ncbi:MAG: polysaccharide biosynthesis/export family protein [Dysgonamonadaceae bacterium]|jgi:polysaccharide export outer membrane protein|nr:polysaccharide biosynthesis/export family protein [Dysgonamonadaceae bacterium]
MTNNNKRTFSIIALFLAIFILTGCGSTKKVLYFQDIDEIPPGYDQYANTAKYQSQIIENDNLRITVSALNELAAAPFNVKMENSGMFNANNIELSGYLVDEEGNINFPVIGKVHLAGLTKAKAEALLVEKIAQEIENPVVNIRFLNYKIFVLGEVSRPGDYIIRDEKISIPEALAMAGDMTIYGNRNDVLICRVENGEKKFFHVDMTSASLFYSDSYYLQQNDILYVQQNKRIARNASNFTPNLSIIVSVLSILVTATSFFFRFK